MQLQQPSSVQCKTFLLGLYYHSKVPPPPNHTTTVSLHLKPSRSKQNKAIQHYIVQPPPTLQTALGKIYNIQVIPSTKFKQCTLVK